MSILVFLSLSSLLRYSWAYSAFIMLARWVLLIPSCWAISALLRFGALVMSSTAWFTRAMFLDSRVPSSVVCSMYCYVIRLLYSLHIWSCGLFYAVSGLACFR